MKSLNKREKGFVHLFRKVMEERNEELGEYW